MASDATTARADAVKIAEDIKPFHGVGRPGPHQAFGEELAARGSSASACAGGNQEERRSGPRTASASASPTSRRVPTTWRCSPSRWPAATPSSPAIPSSRSRSGRSPTSTSRPTIPTSAANAQDDGRRPRGGRGGVAENIPYALDPATLQETAANAIAQLKEAGVTTVIFAGDPVAPREFTREATKQEYFPEWFLNISALVDTNAFARTYDQEQWKHAFGLTALAARVDHEMAGARVPLRVVLRRAAEGRRLRRGDLGRARPSSSPCSRRSGPNLTRQSFADALFRLEPSPTASPPPRSPGASTTAGPASRATTGRASTTSPRSGGTPRPSAPTSSARKARASGASSTAASATSPASGPRRTSGLRRGGHVDDLRRGARERGPTGLRAARAEQPVVG